ncbi:esterase [Lutibacter profundi]|uniref:Esterase n=1 Tax=Lutibacter profundi TaxID=1622118 RepID=A0A109RQ38_9FLAO|nr:alpha/beta hydrolase-fold protein [Lutibacter profundi]AMC11981.1 esterase [Lutibacter profundi]
MKFIKIFLLILISVVFYNCKNNKTKKPTNEGIKVIAVKAVLSSGKLERVVNFPSKFVQPRNVDIWLPNNYSSKNKYAVLYMHDGQMLFDSTKTWNHQEWKVDEIVGKLLAEKKIKNTIVVGVWNRPKNRHTDYYPKKAFEFLPKKFKDSIFKITEKQYVSDFKVLQSDNYLKFIVKEVKPYIDSHYSTFTTKENTFIAGSSMGGLISWYALCEYPNIFGGAACLSTHWIGFKPQGNSPVPNSFFTYLEQNLPSSNNHKIYFDYGTKTLDKFYLPYQHRVDEILKTKGYNELNSKNLKFEGLDHSENSWNQRFQIPVEFLLKK